MTSIALYLHLLFTSEDRAMEWKDWEGVCIQSPVWGRITFIFLFYFLIHFLTSLKLARSFRNSFFHFFILNSLNSHALLGILSFLYLEFTKLTRSFTLLDTFLYSDILWIM